MNYRNNSFTRGGAPKIDAISSLQGLGYTYRQAKNIRAWLPRQFDLAGYALPRANLEFWKAYEIVKDMQKYKRNNALSLQFSGYAKGRTIFQFTHNEFLEYRSPTLQSTVWSLEFVRHFGDGLWRSSHEACQGGPRELEYIGENIRLKRGELAARLEELETIPNVHDINSDNPYLPKDTERYIENATESIRTMLMMTALCHSNLTLGNGWAVGGESLFITRFQSMDYPRYAFALDKLCALNVSKERALRMHSIVLMQNRNHIAQMATPTWIPAIVLESRGIIGAQFALIPTERLEKQIIVGGQNGYFPSFLTNVVTGNDPWQKHYSMCLTIPEVLADVYTHEEWTDGIRNVFR